MGKKSITRRTGLLAAISLAVIFIFAQTASAAVADRTSVIYYKGVSNTEGPLKDTGAETVQTEDSSAAAAEEQLPDAADEETDSSGSPEAEENAAVPETPAEAVREVPAVYIKTANGKGTLLERPDGYQKASMTVLDTYDNVLLGEGSGRVKVRGNSTGTAPKKPYTFKLDEKADLMGFGAAKKWVLLAECFDPTMMRNSMAFDLAEALGLSYTPQHCIVELWLDNKYMGMYTLTEGIDTGKDRIDIDAENGDFLLEAEKERIEDGVTYFETSEGLRFAASDPEEPSEAQADHIETVLEAVTAAIASGNWQQVSDRIDVASFAAVYLLNEYLSNVDFFESSTYFYYKDGKLFAGPVWDYDISAGNVNPAFAGGYEEALSAEGIRCAVGFYAGLTEYFQFRSAVHNLAAASEAALTDLYADGGWIDRFMQAHAVTIGRNASEAGWLPGTWHFETSRVPDETYEANAAFLRDWLRARHAYLKTVL